MLLAGEGGSTAAGALASNASALILLLHKQI